jgi:uncharacterized protein
LTHRNIDVLLKAAAWVVGLSVLVFAFTQLGVSQFCVGCFAKANQVHAEAKSVGAVSAHAMTGADTLISAARAQIGVVIDYDPAYQRLAYPNGDVATYSGVCTDVVIRALRVARKLDLQQAVHLDMRAHFARYPKRWGLKRSDANIDHRRVPNLETYFARQGWRLKANTPILPGDLVTFILPAGQPHIAIASDRKSLIGDRALMLHNIGWGTKEDDLLATLSVHQHFRLPEHKSLQK